MARITEVGKIKAAKMVAAGEGTYAYKPVHPELCRDYYCRTAEAAEAHLDKFCADYADCERSAGSVVTMVRVERMVKDFVTHRQMQMGAPMWGSSMQKRVAYLGIK